MLPINIPSFPCCRINKDIRWKVVSRGRRQLAVVWATANHAKQPWKSDACACTREWRLVLFKEGIIIDAACIIKSRIQRTENGACSISGPVPLLSSPNRIPRRVRYTTAAIHQWNLVPTICERSETRHRRVIRCNTRNNRAHRYHVLFITPAFIPASGGPYNVSPLNRFSTMDPSSLSLTEVASVVHPGTSTRVTQIFSNNGNNWSNWKNFQIICSRKDVSTLGRRTAKRAPISI